MEQLKWKRPKRRPYEEYDYYEEPTDDDKKKVAVALSDPNNMLQSLAPDQELDTQFVREYFNWLKKREEKAPNSFLKCHFFDPGFYTKFVYIGSGYNYD